MATRENTSLVNLIRSLSAHVVQLETVLEAIIHVDASRIASSRSDSQG